jgi:thioredoxin reductase (NADPH)
MRDLVIIWAWGGGFTAWMYAWRYGLKPLIIWANEWGMITENPVVENFPWFDQPTSGYEIMQKIKNQALTYGAEYVVDTVKEINPIDENNFSAWYNIETTFKWTIQAKAIILAIWTEKNMIWVKWEKEFFWKWVSYCATCDGFFYRWKTTAVVGWWDTAFIEALYLANICKKVYLIHRRDSFRAEAIRVEKAKQHPNIEFVLNSQIEEIYWNNLVEWVKVNQNWEIKDLKLDWVFIAIWMTPNKMPGLDDYLERDNAWYIKVDSCTKTNLPGVLAVGDCSTGNCWFRQLVVACAEWAVAAENTFKYLSKK